MYAMSVLMIMDMVMSMNTIITLARVCIYVESFSVSLLGPKGLIRSRFVSFLTRWIVCVRKACTHILYCVSFRPFFRAGGSVTPNALTSNSRVLQSYPVIPRRRTMSL